MLRVTSAIQRLIEADATTGEIAECAKREGMRTMLDDGIGKARLGLTGLGELAKLNATLDHDLSTEARVAA